MKLDAAIRFLGLAIAALGLAILEPESATWMGGVAVAIGAFYGGYGTGPQ